MRDANAVREIERVLMRAGSTLDDARDNLSTAATALMRMSYDPTLYAYVIEAKRALSVGDVSRVGRALDDLIEVAFVLADDDDHRADLWSARCA